MHTFIVYKNECCARKKSEIYKILQQIFVPLSLVYNVEILE